MVFVLEIFFIALLILAAIAAGAISLAVVYNLYRGQK